MLIKPLNHVASGTSTIVVLGNRVLSGIAALRGLLLECSIFTHHMKTQWENSHKVMKEKNVRVQKY